MSGDFRQSDKHCTANPGSQQKGSVHTGCAWHGREGQEIDGREKRSTGDLASAIEFLPGVILVALQQGPENGAGFGIGQTAVVRGAKVHLESS